MKTRKLEQMAICLATALCAQGLLAAEKTDQKQGQQSGQTSAQTAGSSTNGVRISKLKGADVKSKDGQDLGKLEDLVIDPKTGQITFAIVGKGAPFGLGDKPHPVPWQDVKINSEKQVTLNVDKQKMQSAPTANADYSDLNNPDNVVVIYRFYEIVPAGAPGETPGGAGGGSNQSQPKSTPPNSDSGSNP